jgi:hypothetical protein
MGLKDFRKAVQDVQRCLRPGGLLIWIEPDYGVFSEDRMAYAPVASDARPNGSWTARYIFGMSSLKVCSDFYGTWCSYFTFGKKSCEHLAVSDKLICLAWKRSWMMGSGTIVSLILLCKHYIIETPSMVDGSLM